MPQTSGEVCRLLIADDHAIVRDGLRAILKDEGFEVVGEASDGLEAIRLCEELGPDIAVVDISMPLLNGIDSARQILKASPKTKDCSPFDAHREAVCFGVPARGHRSIRDEKYGRFEFDTGH